MYICSIGFYQMSKIAVTPSIVLAEFILYKKKVSLPKVNSLSSSFSLLFSGLGVFQKPHKVYIFYLQATYRPSVSYLISSICQNVNPYVIFTKQIHTFFIQLVFDFVLLIHWS